MIKTTIIALATAVAVSGAALPAFAADDDDNINFSADDVVARLNERGVNATGAEQWGGLIRAWVTLDNGSRVMEFFTPDTLAPVAR